MIPLHPSIVHFPPVLLLAAAVLYGWGLLGKKSSLQVTAFCFHAIGLVFCIVAIFTGDFEADRIDASPTLLAAMTTHENLVTIASYAFGVLGIWAYLRQRTQWVWEKMAFLLVYVGMVVLLFIGAHIGGKMVFEQGAGVQRLGLIQTSTRSLGHIPAPLASNETKQSMPTFTREDTHTKLKTI